MKENNIKESVVIGFGSIGRRHARLLRSLSLGVSVVSKRKNHEFETFQGIHCVLKEKKPDYIVVSNKTCEHYTTIKEIGESGFQGTILMEKPLFDKVSPLFPWPFRLYVGYNLRFHPVVRRIFDLTRNRRIFSMHVYCGQYLPLWRKDRDYKDCYSSFKKEGGGVLRDLSHELDYVSWIAGNWKRLAANGGKVSRLEIDSDDVFSLLIETKACPAVTLQINYLDLEPRREIILNADGLSLKADLIRGVIHCNDEIETFELDPDETYLSQHRAVLNGRTKEMCSLDQGNEILKLIEAAEEASNKKIWIENN